MEDLNEDQQDDHNEIGGRTFKGASVFAIGLFMLLVGFFVGWLVGRPATLPPESNVVAQPNLNQEQVSDTESVAVEPVIPAPTTVQQAVEEASQLEPIIQSDESSFPLPTPTYIEPEEILVLGDPEAPVKIVEFSDY